MAFPVAKLASLLLRQLSKPIANYVKERAKTHPFFRRTICMPPAQIYNWCEVKMKMWVLNMGKPVEVPQLNETMAIELGANLLGETIIFSIAALLLSLEYARQVRKESAKEEARKKEMDDLNNELMELYFKTEKQEAQLTQMRRVVIDLQSQLNKITRPFGPKTGPESSLLLEDEAKEESKKAVNVKYDVYYHGGAVLRALDYVTYQIPNGHYRD